MDPKMWGPPAWEFIHTVALGYPSAPSHTDKTNYRNFYTNIGNILPCPVCQIHYNEFLSGRLLDLDEALESTESLFNWTVDAHNNVNRHNGKKIWTFAEAVEKYHAIYIKSDNKGVKDWCAEISSPHGVAFILVAIILCYFLYANTMKHNSHKGRSGRRHV